MVTIKEIESYKDYGRCVSISNGKIEAMVTIDLGPRIIFFGFEGGQNFMCTDREGLGFENKDNYEEFFGKGRKWESYGGHRIWISPEAYPDTYTPDDKPVKYEVSENGALFIPEEDVEVNFAKTLEVIMSDDDYSMQVNMTAKNTADTPRDFSVWSLSVCAAGGTMIIPMNTNDTGLLSNRIISVWPYTDMSDDRIYWGKKYVTVSQDVKAEENLKLGFDLNCGTAYYVLGNEVFKKQYETKHPDARYPDGGCSFETFTNETMLEFETLSELKTVAKGEVNTLSEIWTVTKLPDTVDLKCDCSIDKMIEKL